MVRTSADIDFKLMSGSFFSLFYAEFCKTPFGLIILKSFFIVSVCFFCLLWRCVVKTVFVLALFLCSLTALLQQQ